MEVQNESLTYDLGSFVGEVGGYLGLLLGASILSIFDEGQLLYHKLKSLICHWNWLVNIVSKSLKIHQSFKYHAFQQV